MRVVTALVLGLSLAVGPSGTPRQGRPAPQAVFRAGVDVVQLDVLVLDRNRRPVRGLTAEEFTVLERGKPQPVMAFTEVDVPDPVAPSAAWVRDVGPDVTSNDLQTRRLILLLMDDGFTGIDEGEPRLVRQVAMKVIESLGPADLAAVVFTEHGRFQNFTSDRAQLVAAVESFQPRNWGRAGVGLRCGGREGGCAINALSNISQVLRTAPPGRKAIMYIGPGVTFNASMTDPDGPAILPQIKELMQNLQQSNASIYTFDPRGVMVRPTPPGDRTELSLADATGGRDIRFTNDPAGHVAEIFRENSSYYLLGYRSTDVSADGRFRKIEVKVNRPGVEVRARSGYYAQKPDRRKPSATASTLDAAVLRGMPSGDLPLRVTAAAFRVPGRGGAEVAIIAAVREPALSETAVARLEARPVRRVNVVATAFDANWRSVGAYRQTLELMMNPAGGGDDTEYEVVSRLKLAPGRYEVRFGAESGGRAGSVFATLDVPNFAREAVSLSGVLVECEPAPLSVPKNPLAGLAPIVPTSVREFFASDRVAVFARVYQGSGGAAAPVQVTSRVVDDDGRPVAEDRTRLDLGQFGTSRAADYRWRVPLAGLKAGEYLVTIEATVANRSARRDVRFSVR